MVQYAYIWFTFTHYLLVCFNALKRRNTTITSSQRDLLLFFFWKNWYFFDIYFLFSLGNVPGYIKTVNKNHFCINTFENTIFQEISILDRKLLTRSGSLILKTHQCSTYYFTALPTTHTSGTHSTDERTRQTGTHHRRSHHNTLTPHMVAPPTPPLALRRHRVG